MRPQFCCEKNSISWKIKKEKKGNIAPRIDFKPGPVQDSGFRFWPGQSGQSLFKKNSKRRCFNKKKTKINELQPSFAGSPGQTTGSAESHRVITFPIFSSTRPGSSPGPAGSRIDPPGRTGFQNYHPQGKLQKFLGLN